METTDIQKVKEAVAVLIEHFDAVQVFCTRDESGELDGTVNIVWGGGNWFARYGHVKHWIAQEERRAGIEVEDEEGDEGEG